MAETMVERDELELLPCPFCGAAPKRSRAHINPWAICPTEGCIGARQALVLDDPRQVAAWNRRPLPSYLN